MDAATHLNSTGEQQMGKSNKREKPRDNHKHKISNKAYLRELERLQVELVKLQEWVKESGHRVVII